MRLFAAIELDEGTRAAVHREQRRLAEAVRASSDGDDGGLRLVRPEQLHLTLVFLGEVSASLASAVADAFSTAIALAPFTIAFGAPGMFPPRGNPRVLWLGLSSGEAQTRAVHAEVAGRVLRAGATLEERAFAPHLTLGRWRDGRARHRTAVAGATPTAVPAMTVTSVTLFESRLSGAGATHTPLATSVLRCP